MERSLEVQVRSDGADQFRSDMDSMTDSLMSFRGAVGLAGGALAAFSAGALAASVNEARKFEDAMVEVQKVSDEATAAALESEIKDMAETIPLAQTELAGLTADAARFGIEGPDNIRSFTESVARMATATELSTDEAGEAMARLATLTETPVSEIENLGSAINTLSNNFATSSQEIVDSMLRGSASLSQFGLNQREIAGLSAALNEVSESSERAGTRLRRVGQELMNPDKVGEVASALGMTASEFTSLRDDNPAEIFRRLAETMAEGGDGADQLRRALGTASRQAIAGLGQNLEGMSESLSTSNEAFAEGTSLQREFEAQNETLNSQLQLLKNNLTNAAIEVGQVFLPAITDTVEGLNDFLSSSDSVLDALSAQEKAWGLVAVAIGGTLLAIGAFLGGPVAALVAAAGAIGAAFSTNFLGIRDEAERVFGGLQDMVNRVIPPIRDVIEDTLGEIQTAWRENGDEVLSNLRDAYNAIKTVVEGAISVVFEDLLVPLLEKISSVYETHLGDLIAEFIETFNVIADRFRFVVNRVILPLWNMFGDEIMTVVRNAFSIISTVVSGALDGLLSIFRAGLALIRGDWKEAFSIILDFATRQVDRFKSIFGDIFDVIENNLIDPVTEGINDLIDIIEDFIDDIVEALEKIGEIPGELADAVPGSDVAGDVAGGLTDLASGASGGFVEQDGLAQIHKGEAIVPPDKLGTFLSDVGGPVQGDAARGGETRFDITVEVPAGSDGRQIGRELADELERQNLSGTSL